MPRPTESYDDFEHRVIAWIREWRGDLTSHITPDTYINSGLRGLGIDGDDAAEMLQYLHRKSGVDFKGFEYDRFFGPEGVPWTHMLEWIKGNRKWNERLSVRMLAQYMFKEISGT